MKFLSALVLLLLFAVSAHAQPPVGQVAPEISLQTLSGEKLNLSSLRGKVVLLDFWASWCGPCRQNNRKLKSFYSKYHDKGFEVFAVSLDADKNDWNKAIRYDGTQWLQVIDPAAASGNQLTRTWNLMYIPSTFLLDKEGKIVAIGPDEKELDTWMQKLL